MFGSPTLPSKPDFLTSDVSIANNIVMTCVMWDFIIAFFLLLLLFTKVPLIIFAVPALYTVLYLSMHIVLNIEFE